jgi:hypothetical protein
VDVSRGRIAVVGVVVAVVLVAAAEIALTTAGSRGLLTTEDVASAFAAERLDVTTVRFDDDGTVMAPADGSFTVVVLPSKTAAERDFEAYADETDPATFARREGNVIVIADETNGEPLSAGERVRVGRALDALATQS